MKPTSAEAPVSQRQLHLLRVLYLIVVVGLGAVMWPQFILRAHPYELMEGAVSCMLAAFSLLCALGLRYPLQMLPILLWELLWKGLWLATIALPAWLGGGMDEGMTGVFVSCVPVLLFPLVMPWRYMRERYVLQAADRWW